MIKKHSLSFRIISRVLAITITLFILILSGYYTYTRNIIQQKTRDYAVQMAGNIAGRIEQQIKPIEKVPQMLAETLEMGVIQLDSLIPILKKILENNPTIFGTSVAFEPGIINNQHYYMPYVYRQGDAIRSEVLGGSNYEYFLMDWYQITKMIEKPYWSEPYYDEGGGKALMATYAVPFYLNNGQGRRVAGVVTVDIGLEWLSDIVSQEHVFNTGYLFLLSRNGMAVTHPDKTMIMNESIFSNAENWGEPLLREIGRDLQQGKSNFRKYNLKGKPDRWIYYANLPSGMWSIAVVYPDKEMFASLKQMNIFLILMIFSGLALVTFLTIKTVNQQTRPLAKITQSARQIAGGDFNVDIPVFKANEEMEELRNAFIHMQEELAIYMQNLRQTTSAKEKIESELRIARDIQMAMIPHSFPPFPNLPQIDLFALLKSAKEVGGDLYDFFLIDNKQFCFAIGDVSGKGVPASLFMAVTRTLLRSIADKEHELSMIMRNLNKSLSANNESCMFVTFFCGILNLETGLLTYSNAGHNPPVLINSDGKANFLVMPKSIPLGLHEEYPFTENSVQLQNGDKVFAYTDGVSEAENSSKQLFGEEAIIDVIHANGQSDPRQLIGKMELALTNHVSGYEQSDDITMMTISYNG